MYEDNIYLSISYLMLVVEGEKQKKITTIDVIRHKNVIYG